VVNLTSPVLLIVEPAPMLKDGVFTVVPPPAVIVWVALLPMTMDASEEEAL
jgi:hypothetical protein